MASCSSSPSSCSSSSLTYASLHSLTNPTPPEADDTYGVVFVDAYIPDTLSSSAVAQDVCSTDCDAVAELEVEVEQGDNQRTDRLSFLALLVTLFRKPLIDCSSDRRELYAMEIGCPTDVQRVAHFTFGRFHGFLGLPVELEL